MDAKQAMIRVEEIDKEINTILSLIKKEREDLYTKMCVAKNTIIQEFYDTYKPKYYRRKGSLFDFCKVVTDGVISVGYEFDSSFSDIEHRVSNEYIFNVVFLQGWHGGARPPVGGDIKPDILGRVPGDDKPHYRKYPWDFEYWGKRAKRNRSPYVRLCGTFDKYIKESDDVVSKNVKRILDLFLEQKKILEGV